MDEPAPSKTRRTIYPDEQVATARENAERHGWARERRADAVAAVDRHLQEFGGLDGLWRGVTGQRIPRSISVSWKHEVGSPVSGAAIYDEHGHYPWETDPVEEPWTVTDPISGHVFPTNDFGAYRESGLDDRGFFDPDLADDSLLVNERYPEKGDEWGVDDGTGWVDADGNRFTFVAYYNHFAVWNRIRDALEAFRDAYLLSGERRFARAAGVVLDRVADVYPDLDISVWTDEDDIWNSHGLSGQGKAVGCIWETGHASGYLRAYDAIFPAMDDADLLAFLSGKADEYALGRKDSAAALRANVEANVVREVLPAVERGQIYGNFGMHQSTVALAGVALDEPDGYTADALDFVRRAGERRHVDDGSYWGRYEVTGGNVDAELVDVIDRDGHPNESPQYNTIMLNGVRRIAAVLDGYDGYDGADLFENVKVERMHDGRIPLTLLDGYFPRIGDSGKTGDPGLGLDADAMVDGFDRYGDERYAQAAALVSDGAVRGDVFDPDPEAVGERIAAVLDAEGPLDLPSTNLAGYGFAALRQGDAAGADGRAAWLYYGRTGAEAGGTSHNHRDALNIGVLAHGLNLAPDLGYPELADYWPKRMQWTTQTVSHNTVMVDAENQRPQWVGTPRHFADDGRVAVVDVEADVYPQADEYRRTTALVGAGADDESSYVVDFFRVAGGDEHLYSFHGAEGDADTTGLDLRPQDGGTYAGPDVPRPDHGEDTAYNENVGNGFNYLDDVERDASPSESFGVDWAVEDTWDVREDDDPDVHLRLTMCTDCDDVALADGRPPQKPGNPESLRYLLARRRAADGEADISSAFVSVLEPYESERVVDSIEAVPVESATGASPAGTPRAVRVELADGRTDYVVSAPEADETLVVDGVFRFRGAFGAYAERDGDPEYARVTDGTLLAPADGDPLIERERGRAEGELADFTRELVRENELVVAFEDAVDTDALEGARAYVETDHERNGAYEIRGADLLDGGETALDVGPQTTVRGYVDAEDPDAGYEYVPSEGARCVVPATAVWRARD